ncbi:MAG: hypothetical protein EOP83_03390 [Verrucomicrobiaceae bacterium]|nr:MAG: hypothetical protein EOP83_03390 [Verrucomicrobiaceae bacterium]
MPRRITALSVFGRTLRNEPAYGIYKIRIYVTKDRILAEPVKAWLSERYTRRMGLWQIVTYPHTDGNHYVNYIELQKVTEAEMVEIRLRWGWSDKPVFRDGRLKNKRLTKQQRAALNDRIAKVRQEFFDSLVAG